MAFAGWPPLTHLVCLAAGCVINRCTIAEPSWTHVDDIWYLLVMWYLVGLSLLDELFQLCERQHALFAVLLDRRLWFRIRRGRPSMTRCIR